MKKAFKFCLVLGTFLASSLFVGCSSDDDENNEFAGETFTNEELAQLLADSFISSGLTSSFSSLASYASSLGVALKSQDAVFGANENCGQTESFNEPFNFSGEGISSTGQSSYSYTLNCVGDVPTSIDSEISIDSFTEGPDYTSSIFYILDANLANLTGTGPFALEGSVDWESSFLSVETGSATYDYSWTITGGQIDRTTYELVGGSGTIEMLIEVGNFDDIFEASATYTVASNGNISVTINGETYVIDPQTGTLL